MTFDDGYRDNLTNALPIAESKGVPITIFVTSGILGNHDGFWWDRLGTLLRARPPHVTEIDLPIGGRNVRLPLGSSGIRADLDSVRGHLLPLRVTDIERALDAVSERWQVGSAPPPDAETLSLEDLRHLAASDTATIGAHTVDHVRLRDRPAGEQQDAIAGSKRELEQSIGHAVAHFAYPFGYHTDFDDRSVERRAFGWVRHRVHRHPRNGPFLGRSVPPSPARGHGLGTAWVQGSAATMETRVSDAAHAGGRKGNQLPDRPTVSVVICAYSDDRWPQLKKSVASAEAQTSPPIEIIVCIDHNEGLLQEEERRILRERTAQQGRCH